MAEKTMTVRLEQVGPAAFEATAGSGGKLIADGAPDIGGEGRGMRPMELLLASVASCSVMDVVHILRKGRVDNMDVLLFLIHGLLVERPQHVVLLVLAVEECAHVEVVKSGAC